MEATSLVNIRSLAPYRHLFPKAALSTTRLKRNATVFDTVNTVTEAIREHAWQVEAYVDQELRGLSTYQACEKVWYFLKNHIRYQRDKKGYEQVKTPRRLISEGYGDCDDYTFFINCCMAVLKVEGVINRITKYSGDYYQHIYPLVPIGNGRFTVVDCVVHAFDYEEPYTTKKDYEMELQILDGIDQKNTLRGVDAQDLFDDYDMGVNGLSIKNLGSGIKNVVNNVATAVQSAAQNVGQNIAAAAQNVAQTVQTAVQSPLDLLHATNILNPGTALLRMGFLIAMKADTAAIASNIKWAYLSKEDAVARGIDPDKYDKLKKIFDKAEEIFYGAGGDKPSLRKAILEGSGNSGHEIAGLGEAISSAAAIAAAASAIAALAGLIKQVGSIFKKDTPPAANNVPVTTPPTTQPNFEAYNPDLSIDTSDWGSDEAPTNPTVPTSPTYPGDSTTFPTPSTPTATGKPPASRSETPSEGGGLATFWENNKKWALPTGIGVAAVGAGLIIYKVVKSKKNKNKSKAVNGTPPAKADKRSKRKSYVTPVALM